MDSPRPSITIHLASLGEKTFLSLEDIHNWRESEKKYWNLILEIRSKNIGIVQKIEDHLGILYQQIDREITQAINSDQINKFEKIAKRIKNHAEGTLRNHSIVFSQSPEGNYIKETQKNNPHLAAYLAAALMGLEMEAHKSISVEANFLAVAFRHNLSNRDSAEIDALRKAHEEWSDLLGKSKITLGNSDKDFKETISRSNEQILQQEQHYSTFTEDSESRVKAIIKKASDDLHNIEATYDEQMAVQASTLYWKEKAKSHGEAVEKLARASIGVGIMVIGLLVLETVLVVGPTDRLIDLEVWKASMILLTAIISVWAVRVLVRVLLSNIHLRADAVERRTMIMTYLALLRKGQGPSEDQRELILQTLFRPSSTGIIKDDALPPIASQWLNTITHQ